MARKAPTGAKHDRCIDHAEHPYPAKGMLCIGPTIGREGMIAFADLMAAKAAERHAAFLAEPVTLPSDGSHARAIAENVPVNGVDRLCTGRAVKGQPSCAFGGGATIHLHDARGGAVQPPADAAALAELVARFRSMRGLPTDTYVAAVARKARAPKVEPEPVAEPVAPDPMTICNGCDSAPALPESPAGYCAACEAAARGPVSAPEPAPAPVLVASEPSSRPTCPRCGQSFRKSGNGLAWHVANRPDCVKRPALSIAS